MRALLASLQEAGIAVLLGEDARMAKKLGADGVHLDLAAAGEAAAIAAYDGARAVLGAGAIVGVGVGLSRHNAMVLGERGADYVAFGNGAQGGLKGDRAALAEACERIAWWAELFVVPGVAWGVRTRDAARAFVEAGAEWIAVNLVGCLGRGTGFDEAAAHLRALAGVVQTREGGAP